MQESRAAWVWCVGGLRSPRPPAPGDESPGPLPAMRQVAGKRNTSACGAGRTESWLGFWPLESNQKSPGKNRTFPWAFLTAFPRMLSGIRVGGEGRRARNRATGLVFTVPGRFSGKPLALILQASSAGGVQRPGPLAREFEGRGGPHPVLAFVLTGLPRCSPPGSGC